MGRRDRTPAKIFGFGLLVQLAIFIGIIWFAVWGINTVKENHPDATLPEIIGIEAREIKEEFNKGYNPTDTLVIDTLEVSPVPLDSPN